MNSRGYDTKRNLFFFDCAVIVAFGLAESCLIEDSDGILKVGIGKVGITLGHLVALMAQ